MGGVGSTEEGAGGVGVVGVAEEGGADGFLGDAEVAGELGGGEGMAAGKGEEGVLGIRLGGRGVAGVLLGGDGAEESAEVGELGGGHVADAGVGGGPDGGVDGDGVGAEASGRRRWARGRMALSWAGASLRPGRAKNSRSSLPRKVSRKARRPS